MKNKLGDGGQEERIGREEDGAEHRKWWWGWPLLSVHQYLPPNLPNPQLHQRQISLPPSLSSLPFPGESQIKETVRRDRLKEGLIDYYLIIHGTSAING